MLSTARGLPSHLAEHPEYVEHGGAMPFVASTRNPAKKGWPSNSNAQVTAPSKLTPCFRASSYLRANEAAV